MVKIIFGRNSIQKIAEEIPQKSNVLIVYGGGSIKKNGVYDQVMNALSEYKTFEFSGIEPNPHYETCMKAVEVIKQQHIDYVLAVGGGSVIDAVKFIVAAACYEEGDAWDIIEKSKDIKKALPFGTILTLPATGSEMNHGSVITQAETQNKMAFNSVLVYPKFSVLDPTTTFTLPMKQVGNGIVDTFVHLIEQYLNYYEGDSTLTDHMTEAVLKTLVEEGRKVFKDPNNYDVRANLMWASTWGLNGWLGMGVPQDWATHQIGHELTAFYALDHAQTLAIVLPGVMTVMKHQKAKKIISLGREVFGIKEENAELFIDKTIRAVELFFNEVGIKTRLSDYGLGDEAILKVADRMEKRGWVLGERRNITPEVIREILSLRK